MVDRTLQFCGYAYGTVPVQLNAHINGQVVFSGAVDTLNEPLPALDINTANAPPLFSVTSSLFSTEFSGSYPMTVTVGTGAGVYLCEIKSNYMPGFDQTANVVTPGNAITFTQCYYGTPANGEGTPDPRSSVQIDGVTQVPPLPPSSGCWTWAVNQGSTLSHNLNIGLGNVAT
jgi:hypothetical protein